MRAAPEWLAAILRHKTYAALFVGSAVLTFVLTPAYVAAARRLGWLDRPGGRKQHDEPTPTMGGLVVLFVAFVGIAAAMSMGNRVSQMLYAHRDHVLGAAACTVVMMLVGVVDDRRGLSPRIKLLAQTVLALAAFLLGFQVSAVTVPGLGSVALGPFSLPLSVLWIVGITNAINLTDGLDGLAAGVCLLAAATNAAVAIYLQNYYMAVMMTLLAGALLGFLRWNFHPARVFLGDTGSMGLGMYLALCSLYSAQKSPTIVMILVPLCALGYPIFDTLAAVARRTLRGQPLFASDRDHIHHRLVSAGVAPRGAALRIYAASVVLVGICILLSSANHLAIGLGLAAALALAMFSVRVLGYMEWGDWNEQFRGRQETKRVHAAAALARMKLATAAGPAELVEALGVLAAEIGATAIEIDWNDETHRWDHCRRDAAGALHVVEFCAGALAGRLETSAPELAARDSALWDEICRLAAQRARAWSMPR
jgi:UDP-GlcNAc:undecaprenyl-phosphate GlcNAc-1-phosphate transferase